MSPNAEDIAFLHCDLKAMVHRLKMYPFHWNYEDYSKCENDVLECLNRIADMKSQVNTLFELLTNSLEEIKRK